jgi:glycosyltransferase involved in cell wall biosynthesis
MTEVSVILPIHNGEAYLGEAIASVLAQEACDFELLVLDDDSSDRSSRIALAFGDPRLRYSRNPTHLGLFRTLNRGFVEARAPLVRLWAQDDRMVPGSLARFQEFARTHPTASLIYSDFHVIGPDGVRTGAEAAYVGQRERTPDLADSARSAVLFWSHGCLPGNISTVMVRRSAWEEVGGFQEGKQQAPDYDMWVRLSERADVGFIRDKVVEVRAHEGQLSRVGQRRMTTIEEELPVIKALEARLAKWLPQADLDRSWITGRGRQQMHWIVRALARGDLKAALHGLKAASRSGRLGRQALFWLASMNGRLFTPSRDEIHDQALRKITGATGAIPGAPRDLQSDTD